MDATENSTQKDADSALKEAVRAEMHKRGMSQARLAKESGINQARLSQWFAGKYPGNTELVVQELTRWLNSVQGREKATGQLSVQPDWKATPTATSIVNALRYAQSAGDIALVYGGAGVGKTCTARRYQEDNPNVWIATMTPAMNTVAACLERIAFAIGLPEAQPSAVKTENAIVARLEGTSGLLVVDEAQHLPVSGLDAVRSIHDATGVGLALMGNEACTPGLPGARGRRISRSCSAALATGSGLGAPTTGDVETIVAGWGVQEGKARGLCMEIRTAGRCASRSDQGVASGEHDAGRR